MTLDPLAGPGYHALVALSKAVDADSPLPVGLLELVRLRCSQLNGCTYCIRLHTRQALEAGERRADVVADHHTHPLFTPAERSALALAEAVTLVHEGRVPDEVLTAAIRDHGEPGAQSLIWVSLVTNAFNRLAISTRLT
ncbi:carboxymuconolactone decarboxylase family protein [Saccharothrix mutabilis subsp. mutabilis]|uniref:Carboxymuconolactone decarboxylase family protein n=1 Tax=Saccharothrix mutabilis subsp. mutabilis TaxID=66855 RepID=A0ABP3D2F7_9PSEU